MTFEAWASYQIIRDNRMTYLALWASEKINCENFQSSWSFFQLQRVVEMLFFVDRYEEQCGKSNQMAALEGLINSLQILPTA
jgi:hypothetical protein